jgi:hypothetical protein
MRGSLPGGRGFPNPILTTKNPAQQSRNQVEGGFLPQRAQIFCPVGDHRPRPYKGLARRIRIGKFVFFVVNPDLSSGTA